MIFVLKIKKLVKEMNPKSDCRKYKRNKTQSNPRYRNFKQSIFTAGDPQQFVSSINKINGDICLKDIKIDKNIFKNKNDISFSSLYKDVTASTSLNTFQYIFYKFKKGIFCKIRNNKLDVFLPFSNANFRNEWGDKMKAEKKTLVNFLKKLSKSSGYKFNERFIHTDPYKWYANNCIVRYDFSEGDSNVTTMKDMIETLCESREVPDIEFFINRRDFPILMNDKTEPYYHIWGRNHKLVSHNYNKYLPILSMSKSDNYADVLIPIYEDWTRIRSSADKSAPRRDCPPVYRHSNAKLNLDWNNKKNIAIFRGSSTGCNVTTETNIRLKLAKISKKHNDSNFLDAGITKWNLRPRKLENEEYLQTSDKDGLDLVKPLNLEEQSNYKYIINIEGHVAAFRLSIELSLNSVILLVDSDWKIWYSNMLEPYVHYVPVKKDLSNLIDQIKWCRTNDVKCKQIAENAKDFYNKYLQKEGILDFLQKTLVNLKKEMGIYIYNSISPLDAQIQNEIKSLNYIYPKTSKQIKDITSIPYSFRNAGLLEGIRLAINYALLDLRVFYSKLRDPVEIFRNKNGYIYKYNFAGSNIVIKSTHNIDKLKEHKHEAFVGTKAINKLLNYIPNFCYTYGLYITKAVERRGSAAQVRNQVSLMNEHIKGYTIDKYIKNWSNFKFEDILFGLTQLSLVLHVAQQNYGFVHWDLLPWNVIFQKQKDNTTFDYIVDHNKIIRVTTNLIPYIIDFGKSHVIVDNKHYGYVKMFDFNRSIDIITLFSKSILLLLEKNLERNKQTILLKIAKDVLLLQEIRNVSELKEYLKESTKYFRVIHTKDNEAITPIKTYKSMIAISKDYKLNFHSKFQDVTNGNYVNKMFGNNSTQVFNYILSNNDTERKNTFLSFLDIFTVSTIPLPRNLFFLYYTAQQLLDGIETVYASMKMYFQRHHGNHIPNNYIERFESVILFVKKLYKEKINSIIPEKVIYELTEPKNRRKLKYDESSFENINLIEELLNTNVIYNSSWSYKNMCNNVFLNNGYFRMTDEHKAFYTENFKSLLELDPIFEMINIADSKTLRELSSIIYKQDILIIEDKLKISAERMQDCKFAKKYLSTLKKIVHKS